MTSPEERLAALLHDELCRLPFDRSFQNEEPQVVRYYSELAARLLSGLTLDADEGPLRAGYEPLREALASWIHGDTCTCPYRVEPADLARADEVLAALAQPASEGVKET